MTTVIQLDLDDIRTCFSEARREQEDLTSTCENSLAKLDELQQRLRNWQVEMSEDNQVLKARCDELAELAREADDKDSELALTAARLEQELAEARNLLASEGGTDEDSQARVLALQQELEQLQLECGTLRSDRDKTQQELAKERESIQNLEAELEAARDGLTSELESRLAAINDELDQTRNELEGRTEILSELERDRTALETELEMVRSRAAELSEALNNERKQMAEDRAEWSGELKQMRRLLERQSRLSDTPTQIVAAANNETISQSDQRTSPTQTNDRSDPVVGSVLAQFERIRQQRANKRLQKQGA